MQFRQIILKNYVIYVGLLIIAVAGMQLWFVNNRLDAFHQYNLDIGYKSVLGIENQVAFYISEKRRIVELFAKDNLKKIREFSKDPDNDELHEQLDQQIKQHFPDRFAFSVTDIKGIPRFVDFDGKVSEMCLSDIKEFSESSGHYESYVHPNSQLYHFDIMVRYGEGGQEGIFFVSFSADMLANIIDSIQSANHQLMLILPKKQDLIEVIAEGARNKLVRADYHLSDEERARITMRNDIKGTRWQVIDFHLSRLHEEYLHKLILESTAIFLIFISIALLFVVRLRREERNRETAEKERHTLLSVVSHEFRSPVSIIKSALDLIAYTDAGKENKTKEYVNMALGSTSSLISLVDDFLDIQKIESDSLDFNMQETILSSIVANSVVTNGLYAEEFNVSYEIQRPLVDDYMICDEQRITQVMTNLLTNAAKYGGENDIIEVSMKRLGKDLCVYVSDHGLGIPAEFQSKVFNKFTMAAKSDRNKQKIKSSGLGLSIAKAIIEQHGGTIGFTTRTEPDSDTGTIFWFKLPVM